MKKSYVVVCCILIFGVMAEGGEWVNGPMPCFHCSQSVPPATVVVKSMCITDLSEVYSEDPVVTKLPDVKINAGGCKNPEPMTTTQSFTYTYSNEISWSGEFGVTVGTNVGLWKVEGNVTVGVTATWGSTQSTTITLESVSPGNAEIQTTYALIRVNYTGAFEEDRRGLAMCRYPDASDDAAFLVTCPRTQVKKWGETGKFVSYMSNYIGEENVCPLDVSGICNNS